MCVCDCVVFVLVLNWCVLLLLFAVVLLCLSVAVVVVSLLCFVCC